MKRYEGRLAGILGTVIIHLLAAIIFFSARIGSMKRESAREFVMLFEQVPEEPQPEIRQRVTSADEGLPDVDQMIRNIVRNLANPDDPVIDPQEYQDRVKEELIKKGLLGEDNFIDEWKRKENEDEASIIAENIRDKTAKPPDESKPVNYQGPTRVYFSLENRYHTYLPIPVYKCPTGGKVTVAIEVGRDGNVITAKIDVAGSSTSDPCLTETAIGSAMKSRFNPDQSAPQRQQGTVTFHFVPQK